MQAFRTPSAATEASITLACGDRSVEVRFPTALAADIAAMFGGCLTDGHRAVDIVFVRQQLGELYSISGVLGQVHNDLTRGDLPTFLMEEVICALVADLRSAVALHAGAVSWNGTGIAIVGQSGSGKSSLIAWLVDRGFKYLSDELLLVPSNSSEITGFPRALVIKPDVIGAVSAFDAFAQVAPIFAGSHVMLPPGGKPPTLSARCGLIVFPHFVSGSELRITRLSPAEAALNLVRANLNARNLEDGGLAILSRLSRNAAAITLQYGGYDQISGTLDSLLRMLLADGADAESARRFLTVFPRRLEAESKPIVPKPPSAALIPASTPRRGTPKLTIGMATYDDYDGVYFTVQSLRLYHPEVMSDAEILVIDNNPAGPCARALKQLDAHIENYRYVPLGDRSGTAVRDFVFSEASGRYVLCIDSHVLLEPGALSKLLEYFETNPDSSDLLQGPMLYDNLASVATHFDPKWSAGMYGQWANDPRGTDPNAEGFEIPMQGLGLFACRRDAWLGFNPDFRGFGGEEGYIHEKFRQAGGRTLCLPFLRWLHRFQRPMGVPYKNAWEDRIRNYTIGFGELGLPTTEIHEHFRELLGEKTFAPILRQIREEVSG